MYYLLHCACRRNLIMCVALRHRYQLRVCSPAAVKRKSEGVLPGGTFHHLPWHRRLVLTVQLPVVTVSRWSKRFRAAYRARSWRRCSRPPRSFRPNRPMFAGCRFHRVLLFVGFGFRFHPKVSRAIRFFPRCPREIRSAPQRSRHRFVRYRTCFGEGAIRLSGVIAARNARALRHRR